MECEKLHCTREAKYRWGHQWGNPQDPRKHITCRQHTPKKERVISNILETRYKVQSIA